MTPSLARPALDLINTVPKPLAAVARTGLDIVAGLAAKVNLA